MRLCQASTAAGCQQQMRLVWAKDASGPATRPEACFDLCRAPHLPAANCSARTRLPHHHLCPSIHSEACHQNMHDHRLPAGGAPDHAHKTPLTPARIRGVLSPCPGTPATGSPWLCKTWQQHGLISACEHAQRSILHQNCKAADGHRLPVCEATHRVHSVVCSSPLACHGPVLKCLQLQLMRSAEIHEPGTAAGQMRLARKESPKACSLTQVWVKEHALQTTLHSRHCGPAAEQNSCLVLWLWHYMACCVSRRMLLSVALQHADSG